MKKVKEKILRYIDKHIHIIFPAPTIIALFVVVIFPIVYNIYMSFNKWKIGLGSPKFIGLQNYIDAFSDPRFWNGLKVMFFFSGLSFLYRLFIYFPLPLHP